MKRKNLLLIHLESIGWQHLRHFPEAFPRFQQAMARGRLFRSYFSSATSTQMVLAYLLHGNDFEMDGTPGLGGAVGNNPSLMATLARHGYRAQAMCVSARNTARMLPLLAASLPPIWNTNDFAALGDRFERAISKPPFALYVWNLVTHMEHAAALAGHAQGLDDLVGGTCAVADHVLGTLLDTLDRRGLADDTIVVIFGDHGDDYWSHGFKGGILHGVEPYTPLVHVPLLVLGPGIAPMADARLASTIDLAPTCLTMLGIDAPLPFAHSGRDLFKGDAPDCVFSQNFTASQADSPARDVFKTFAASDRSHTLLVSSRGLEMFNHRLDPTNHCNLLHFFEMDRHGDLALLTPVVRCHPHFIAALHGDPAIAQGIARDFARLRTALRGHVQRKRAYVEGRGGMPADLLDPPCLDAISRIGQQRFFVGRNWFSNPSRSTGAAPLPAGG
ncbi:sulfatase-like protein [Stella humosa]|uniref:Sulfatase-like protein n=1 Tax=Stella humosa TaxID=94 RepID=A0A3N1KVI2_9PROT|nr:sulfatase-like hydrolase/transferase [Stella humosa]ROP83964.1 sulfatase-like protein [Stella humosa]BBK33472.1 hypothetical protein STHU_41060 [Stella humosa]